MGLPRIPDHLWSSPSVHAAWRNSPRRRSVSKWLLIGQYGSRRTVLVVESDRVTSHRMSSVLESHPYEVLQASSAATARLELERHSPDLVVLDVKLPDADGYTLLSEIRRENEVPVIVCSGLADPHAGLLRSLALGADDFISKPFDALEFEARVEAVLRRSPRATGRPRSQAPDAGALRLDHARRQVVRGHEAVALSRAEYAILVALTRQPGTIVSHHDLAREIWGPRSGRKDKALSSHVRAVRAKLGPAATITVVPGFGYRLDQD